MLKISTNQSSHVTELRLSDWSKFSVELITLDFLFIGSGPGLSAPPPKQKVSPLHPFIFQLLQQINLTEEKMGAF